MLPDLRENVTAEQLELERASQVYIDRARQRPISFAILVSPEGKMMLYPILDSMTSECVQREQERLHASRKTAVMIVLHLSYLQTGDAIHFSLVNFLEALHKQLQWNVSQSHLGTDYIILNFSSINTPQTTVQDFLKDIARRCLALSLLYRIGVKIHYYHVNEYTESEPTTHLFPSETPVAEFSENDVNTIESLEANEEAWQAAQCLQSFYLQSTKAARIAVGWAGIEVVFGKEGKVEHALSEQEQEDILKNVRAHCKIPEEKISRLERVLADKSRFKDKTKNMMIAERIAKLLGYSYDVVYSKISELARMRAGLVHGMRAENEVGITEQEEFIERAFKAYIVNMSGSSWRELRRSDF